MTYIREYEESDWAAAEYLELCPTERVGNLGTSEDGRVVIAGLELDHDRTPVVTAFFRQIVVPQRTKARLEAQGLRGVEFRQAEIIPDQSNRPEVRRQAEQGRIQPYAGEPWWELRSNIELPPVSDTMTLVDPKERPVPRGTQRIVFRRERPHNHAELHYRRRDVERFPESDLARTWEEWGGQPALVASKRFYRACRELGIDMGWVPVRIDEEQS